MYSFSMFYLNVSLWCLFYYFLLFMARLSLKVLLTLSEPDTTIGILYIAFPCIGGKFLCLCTSTTARTAGQNLNYL